MRVVGFLCVLFLLFVGIYLLVQVRRLWRHQPTNFDDADVLGLRLAPFVRAYRRALPVFATLFVLMMASSLLFGLKGPLEGLGQNVVLVLALSQIVSLVVACFNRPRCLVAPHLREERGLAEELIGGRS